METIQFSNIEFRGGNVSFSLITSYRSRSDEAPAAQVVVAIENVETNGADAIEIHNALNEQKGQTLRSFEEFLKENES